MTIRTVIDKVGPVTIIAVDAEFLDTPRKYELECDHMVNCEFAMSGMSITVAIDQADRHDRFHQEHGPDSTAWADPA